MHLYCIPAVTAEDDELEVEVKMIEDGEGGYFCFNIFFCLLDSDWLISVPLNH